VFNFTRALDRNADRFPDREAVVFYDVRITNRDLNERVNALAAGLRDVGIGRNDVVALLMNNCPEYLAATLAINKLGAIFLALNFRLAPAEWQWIIDHSQARAIVVGPEFAQAIDGIAEQLPNVTCHLVLAEDRGRWKSYHRLLAGHSGATVATAEVGADDIQRLMYTSGTTSRPKGVPLTYGNVLWKTFGHVVEFGLTRADRTLMAGPMYHVGAFDLPGTGTLYVGGSLVILRKFDPLDVMETIERERPTMVWLAPAMVNGILQLPGLSRYDASSVRCIVNGGEKMPVPLIERLLRSFPNAWLADAYGLTETVSGDTFLDAESVLSKIGSVGKPVLHLDVKIEGQEGIQASPNELGEILLRGPKVFHGYWRDPEATAAAIRDGWFRTGDIGRIDEDGYLYIEDRKKDMIVSGGENIASPEVERVLYQHPAVLEAAVVGMPDPRWGEVPKAFVVLREGQSAKPEELIAFCATQLAKFKVPKAVEFIDALPRNPSGKVLKRDLRALMATSP
jgi:fatty-acyl-CoA synthase